MIMIDNSRYYYPNLLIKKDCGNVTKVTEADSSQVFTFYETQSMWCFAHYSTIVFSNLVNTLPGKVGNYKAF